MSETVLPATAATGVPRKTTLSKRMLVSVVFCPPAASPTKVLLLNASVCGAAVGTKVLPSSE